jgi:hypothetical protein
MCKDLLYPVESLRRLLEQQAASQAVMSASMNASDV